MPTMGIEQNITPTSSHLIVERKGKTMPSVGIYRPPGARKVNPQEIATPEVKSVEKPKTKQKQRRPDIQVYVPRAKRTSTDSRLDANPTSTTSVPESRQPAEIAERDTLSRPAIRQSSEQVKTCLESEIINATTPSKYNKEDVNTAVYLCQVDRESRGCVELNPCPSVQEANNLPSKEEVDITSEIVTKIELPVHEKASNSSVVASPVAELYCRDESCSDTDTISDSVINSLQADCENYVKCNNDFINISIRTETPTIKQPVVNTSNDEIPVQLAHTEGESFVLEYPVPVKSPCLVEILPSNEREQKCDDEQSDIGRNREEQNRKNRSIQRGNIKFLSDVLVISDVDNDPSVNSVTDASLNVPSETSRLVPQACDSEERTPKPVDKGEPHSKSRLNPDECTWDMMFDDSGDCLDPFLLEELTNKVGNVSIKTPRSDYKNFTNVRELQPADSLAHIIEIYNFPSEFKTQDLMSIFSGYQSRGFEIKWVDDTHALGVFGNSIVADEVLETSLPFVKTRRLADGTAESRAKARRSSEFLQPYRARPETCPALARRLVTSALGVKLSTARQEREAEKALLKVARDKKKLVARLKDAAWEGTLESTLSNTE